MKTDVKVFQNQNKGRGLKGQLTVWDWPSTKFPTNINQKIVMVTYQKWLELIGPTFPHPTEVRKWEKKGQIALFKKEKP